MLAFITLFGVATQLAAVLGCQQDCNCLGRGAIGGRGLGGIYSGIDAAALVGDYGYGPQTCINHRIEPVIRPVIGECIKQVPVVKNNIRHQEEVVTRNVPVVDKFVTHQEEKVLRHLPIAEKSIRNVVETRTSHVPIVKSRTRTVVEPYTTHVPITESITRPVEDTVVRHIPVIERRNRPIVEQKTRLVPVTEKRLRPIVETIVENIPVKKQVVKNVVEHRVKPVVGPCSVCNPTDFGAAGVFSNGLNGYPSGLTYGAGVSANIPAFSGCQGPLGVGFPFSEYPVSAANGCSDSLLSASGCYSTGCPVPCK